MMQVRRENSDTKKANLAIDGERGQPALKADSGPVPVSLQQSPFS